ncbi:lysophospholipid acyltransferase family protein [Thermovenabulum gondwanense]|uniref:1-acyl-sn-glycerol-3-phosphate acyltransferase n=1 Tax=Thermovenabulum gondwanense TaxID=520767 RepID=A0A162M8K6_9FIRM|nr:lysophospholipid acyltransferase family protein [Thermovenabulum gondwanense]KYO64531.1 1-acyl-sn-glycerol-3-phosphate acyltransferase [Thermovenabulum gondwanense]
MLYRIAKLLCKIILLIFFRIEVLGRENFPKDGPVIVYSNHKSFWDPILIGCMLDRTVNFMAKIELFKYPVFGFILRNLYAFPVNRGAPDRKAIRKALQVLKEGKVLGIFPEGTRSKDGMLKDPEPGIALFAIKTENLKLVPVAIKGNYKFFSKVQLIIGEPIVFESKNEKYSSEKINELSIELFKKVEQLLVS